MEKDSKEECFSPEVYEQLKYYVYRLIDPRNGETFYVGKGKGNRVFAHSHDALKDYNNENYSTEEELADESSAKIKQIREIHNAGLNVIHIIQRWGMDEKTALHVEAALIDCFFGLSNIQNGYASDYGVTNTKVLQESLSAKEYEEPPFKYLIIKIKDSTLSSKNGDMYEAVRASWRIDNRKIDKYKICFAVMNGIVKAIYRIDRWEPDELFDNKRYRFVGEKIDIDKETVYRKYYHKRIPEKYRKKGMASPVLYAPK